MKTFKNFSAFFVSLVALCFAPMIQAAPGDGVLPIPYQPQNSGVYSSPLNGNTNVIAIATSNLYWTFTTNIQYTNGVASSTNTNEVPSITFPVSQHPNIGATVAWYNPTITATNGSNIFKWVRSFDNGRTYEMAAPAALTYTNILPTAVQQAAAGLAQTNIFNMDMGVTNATHIGLAEIDSSSGNATGWFSNYTLNVNMNTDQKYTIPAPR